MCLLQAYVDWIKENGEEEILPYLDKTSQQLFFIGYAQVRKLLIDLITLRLDLIANWAAIYDLVLLVKWPNCCNINLLSN